MTGLPPYSFGRAVCRKCEANDASTEYQVAATCLVWRSGTWMVLDESTPGNLASEAMLRRCRQCGWAWLEACADATPPETAQSSIYPPGAGSGARLQVLASGAMRMYNAAGTIVYDNRRDDPPAVTDPRQIADAARSLSTLGSLTDTRPSWTQGGGRDATP